jgi:lantibiotic biosynthesis protein
MIGPPGLEPARVVADGLSVACEVAGRLADPEVLGAAVSASRRQTTFPLGIQWRDHTVAQGHAGLALLYAAMDAAQPAGGWDRVGHAALANATSAAERAGWIGGSLYTGLAGLGLTAVTLAAGRPRYDRFLTAVDRTLLPAVAADIRALDLEPGGCAVGQFDLISGLSGVGAYLLSRRDVPEAAATLRALLGCLARLLDPGRTPPRWHTPVDHLDQDQRHWYPDGNLNCGLAHGLPGPLALLAISLGAGVEVDGARAASRAAADWLAEHRLDDEWGPNWPNAVPLTPVAGHSAPLARASWCYGAPGVARALWLTGQALDDDRSRELAVAAMRAALARPPEHRGLSSPTFCHGIAGLLQITVCFARDTGLPDLAEAAAALVADLLQEFEPRSLLGYRDVEPGGVRVDQPGLLSGAPGVALALLGATTPVSPSWDRLFLLG